MSSLPDKRVLDFLLVQVCKLHYARAMALFNTIGLYRGQPPVLRALAEQPGLSHSELAARMGVTPATMSRSLDRMEKAGFITRQPDAQDQRVSRVYLTEQGNVAMDQVQHLLDTMAQDTLADFSPEDCEQLHRLLERIRENLTRATEQQAD
ncbi:MAG: MarR family transcriptional regulator [Chloroflexi bacterium]|jgi:DNA-binding MarR family transcriptional regulator|nr:MarR family transcriptional regulator [Chloroflexota bacterium]